nr:hypothetical protein 14 [Balneolaceae bacterium]
MMMFKIENKVCPISRIKYIGIFLLMISNVISCNSKEAIKTDTLDRNIKLIERHLNSDSLSWQPEKEYEIKREGVKINPTFFNSTFQKEGSSILFNFFDKESYKGSIDNISTLFDGEVNSIYGSIMSPYQGNFTISIDSKKLNGSVTILNPRKHYRIAYSSKYKHHVVIEIDENLLDIKEDSVLMPSPDSTNKN